MWISLFLALFTSLSASPVDLHKFHVSRCMVEYNAQEQALQMSMHVFLDDLELALAERGADSLHICTKMERSDAEYYLGRYLEEQVQFSIDGQPVTFTFLGKEISDDLQAVWCYLEVKDLPPFREMTVTYEVLLDLFDDQKNIMHIVGPNRQEGTLLFRKGFRTESVTFK